MDDLEISKNAKYKDIKEIAHDLGLKDDELEIYPNYKAKIKRKSQIKKDSKLILVTSINPTSFGEGKTTITIGLTQALHKLTHNVVCALREPSLGPVLGAKGGATGGGYAQVIPMEDINLHFNGDFHAITTANNLISSVIDNHIYFGNELNINKGKIVFKRCLDLNDRALRDIELEDRHEKFNITAASELMAILCLANDMDDFRRRIDEILIAYDMNDKPIYLKELHCTGAVCAIMKDAIKPNLVQTIDNAPAIIHGGPFANIAHGCNSLIATKLAKSLKEYVVTECGFGADLGLEKYIDIKARDQDVYPDYIVIVVTIKALKLHGGLKEEDIFNEDLTSLNKGLENLEKHIENIKSFKRNFSIALNKFNTDTSKEIEFLQNWALNNHYNLELCEAYTKAGDGVLNLANHIIKTIKKENNYVYTYDINENIETKIEKVCKNIYGAKEVKYLKKAKESLKDIYDNNLYKLPICIAKTQYSLSDDKNLKGRPKDFTITIKDLYVNNGAKFITVLAGKIILMPGLSKHPSLEKIDLVNNEIKGLS